MQTKEWDILSKEDQLSILGGKWVVIDGEVVWVDGIDSNDLEIVFKGSALMK